MGVPGGWLVHAAAPGPHQVDVLLDVCLRLGVDDRPDIHRQPVGIADPQLRHRAEQHLDDAVGDIVLHAQHPQRRTALARAVEGGNQHVGDHLFGQRRRIHDHRVLATGLGHQRDRPPHFIDAAGQRTLQQPGDRGRAGEQHAAHPGVVHQLRADALAAAR